MKPAGSLRIDAAQCAALGQVAACLPRLSERFLPPMPPGTSEETEALFWIVMTAICQQTRTLDGVIGGERVRGSDYLIAALRQHLARHSERWTPAALVTWTKDELCGAVSDDGDPATSTLDRVDERLRLLRGAGAHLMDAHGGNAMALWRGPDRRVATLLARLAPMEAFADPVEKKSHLLLLWLHERGLWPLADPENLDVPVDYHVMRVALRAGLVEVEDPDLRRRLMEQEQATEADDTAVRLAVRTACREAVQRNPGLTPMRLDNVLWMVGRNCCFYEHAPVCTVSGKCWKRETCSLIEAFPHDCHLSCPLSGVCRGAQDEAHRALHETRFDTHFY